ncbi:MAG: sugar ABC transporter ATP-binding protein, partial [Planctomycetaceae bacterium]|nr:sugar ABC transporter ATP-binding protein [Planctomycetaceae bacterium]
MAAGTPPLPPLLECQGITKRFGVSRALAGVDFALWPGEVHGLVGTNGAGKSTLMKILAGAFPHDEGTIRLAGGTVALGTPQAARHLGIAMVYQELSGIGQLSLAENLFLGRQPTTRLGRIDWRAMRERSRDYLAELGIDVAVERRLDRYPLAVRQLVEIARGLHSGARILILDEPTSALSPPEAQRLFELVGRLRSRGVTIVLVSHHLDEVLSVCDRVTILRDGQLVRTAAARELDKHQVIQLMLGERASSDPLEAGLEAAVRLPPRSAAAPRLVAENLSLAGKFAGISLAVAPGECLGLYGYAGAGHQELVHALAGARRPTGGRVLVEGRPLSPGSTRAAVRQGVVLVAADRAQTLVHRAPIYQNVTLSHLRSSIGEWLTPGREAAVTRPLLQQVGCRPPA